MLKFCNYDAIAQRRFVDEMRDSLTVIRITKSETGFHITPIFPFSTSCKSDKTHDKIVHSLTLRQSVHPPSPPCLQDEYQ
jgi:hypothetical protein